MLFNLRHVIVARIHIPVEQNKCLETDSSRDKSLYMKRLYPLCFVFPVPSRHALNLLLFFKNDDSEDTPGAFNSAEGILFIVKKCG